MDGRQNNNGGNNMKPQFVTFYAEYWCQGYEWGWHTKMVYANSFDEACEKIKAMSKEVNAEFINPKYFKDETVR